MLFLLPASVQLGRSVPGSPWAGTYDHQWLFWWVGRSLDPLCSAAGARGFSLREVLHTDHLLFPQGYEIFDTFHNVLNEIVTAPLHLLFPVPIVYVFTLLGSLALAGWFCFLLARRLTGDPWASAVAGVFYMLNPLIFSLIHNGESEMLTHWLLPLLGLCLYGTSALAQGVGTGLVLCALAVGSWYYCVAGLVFTVLFFLVKLIRRERLVRPAILSLGIFLLFAVPFALFTSSHMHEPRLFESDMPSLEHFFYPQSATRAAYERPGEENFAQLYYLGWVVVVCAILGFAKQRDRLFWILVLVVALVLSLGKELRIGQRPVMIGGRAIVLPMGMLYKVVPYLTGIHKPYRLSILASLSLAVCAASFLRGRRRLALVAGAAHVAEFCFIGLRPLSLPLPVSDMRIPPVYSHIRETEGQFAIVEYPFLRDTPVVGRYLYYQTWHEKPLVGPPAEIFPPERDEATAALIRVVFAALNRNDREALINLKVRFVVFHRDMLDPRALGPVPVRQADSYLSTPREAEQIYGLLDARAVEKYGDPRTITVFRLY